MLLKHLILISELFVVSPDPVLSEDHESYNEDKSEYYYTCECDEDVLDPTG